MSLPPDQLSSRSSEPGFEIDCADPAVQRVLEQWLIDSCMSWPGRFRLHAVVSDNPPFLPDDREVLRQPTVRIQAGPPSGTVRVYWGEAPAMAVIHPTRAEVELWFSPGAAARLETAERTFLLVVLVFVLRRLGWYHVHGAALVDPRDRGWLIAGDSNCGKSTTTALLAMKGWGVCTDDIGFLAHGDVGVRTLGFRSRIALRSGGQALLRAQGGQPLPARGKAGFWPEELGGRWVPSTRPEFIAFPRIGERTAIAPLPPREVLASLVKWSQWVLYEPLHAQEHLDVLGGLAAQSRCFDLTLGTDLFANPNILLELTG